MIYSKFFRKFREMIRTLKRINRTTKPNYMISKKRCLYTKHLQTVEVNKANMKIKKYFSKHNTTTASTQLNSSYDQEDPRASLGWPFVTQISRPPYIAFAIFTSHIVAFTMSL